MTRKNDAWPEGGVVASVNVVPALPPSGENAVAPVKVGAPAR